LHINLDGKNALVTGATRGIGAAIATQLCNSGANVIGTGRNDESIRVAHANMPDIDFFAVDFSSPESLNAFADQIKVKKIDILINNAGINKIALAGDVALEDWDTIQQVNVRAPFILSRALAPEMAERNFGRIVNISSIFGHVTRSQRIAYTTSKAALVGMTKTLAADYSARNVLVNALGPGFIDTELTRRILTQEARQELIAQVPMGRLGSPGEIANAVTFLASSQNSFITGQHIIADGGFTIT
jgi:NAD(P)-dependent dehydrogenase (short-subunit alcohol dehydrogenase family)